MFWPPFINVFFFFKFHFSNVNVFMFLHFEPNCIDIEKFVKESGFSNFGHVNVFSKQKFVFWPPFGNGTFFYFRFCWFVVVLVAYRYGASFAPKIKKKK